MFQQKRVGVRLYRWQEAIWLLIVLLTPLLVNLWVEQQFEASKVWILRTLVCVLVGIWVTRWSIGCRSKRILLPIYYLLMLLFLILVLSTLMSANRYIATFGTLDRANGVLTQGSYLLLFLSVATQINPRQSERLLYLIILSAVPICLLSLGQMAGLQSLLALTDARSPLTATLGRANFTGAYLALLLPLTLAALLAARSNWERTGYATLFVLDLTIIVLTQARAAWVAALVGVGLFVWLQVAPRWSRRARWFTALAGAATLLGTLLLLLQSGIWERVIATGGSIAARWTIWRASLRLLWPHMWLGYGADTLELHFPSVYPPQLVYYQGRGVVVDRAHNWLLDWSLSYGVVATILLIWLVAFVLRKGWQELAAYKAEAASPSRGQNLHRHWLAACMSAICAQVVGNLFLFEVAATAVVFWIALGIVTASGTVYVSEQRLSFMPQWIGKPLIIVSLCTLGLLAWHSNIRPMLADAHSWRGTQALGDENYTAALAEYGTAAQYQPQRAGYHVALALTAARLGETAQAIRAMKDAIRLRPTDPVLYTQLASIYGRAAHESPDNVALAYDAFEQAVALAPTIALTYQQYADFALRFGDAATAQMQAERAVTLDATDGFAFGILGWTHLQNDELAAARNSFEQAIKWQPGSADFYLGLAMVSFRQGDLHAARQAIRQSLALDPTYLPALTFEVQLRE